MAPQRPLLRAFAIFLLNCFVGARAFSGRSSCQTRLSAPAAHLLVPPADWAALVIALGRVDDLQREAIERELRADAALGPLLVDLFVFTIATSIGCTFAPVTPAGRAFLIFYALVSVKMLFAFTHSVFKAYATFRRKPMMDENPPAR